MYYYHKIQYFIFLLLFGMNMKPNNSNGDINVIVAVGVTALLTTLGTFFATKESLKRQQKEEARREESSVNISTKSTNSITESNDTQLGPQRKPETLYELNLRGKTDHIYEYNGPKPFKFDEEVVSVFDDMVSRSVPLYCEVIDLAIYWVQRYYVPGTKIYDLGSSTGTTIDVLARFFAQCTHFDHSNLQNKENVHCHFVGVDNSEAMVQSCKQKLEWAKDIHQVDIHCANLLDIKVENASFVIMNYTLQFIPIMNRQELLSSIYAGLRDGGIFLLSEKVRAECSELQETCTWIYEDFKQRRKYTKREIARKKEALMNVLIPFTEEEIRTYLQTAGFNSVEVVAKWNNFTTFVARKKKSAPSFQRSSSSSKKQKATKEKIQTPNLDALLDPHPAYLSSLIQDSKQLQFLSLKRFEVFAERGRLSNQNLSLMDGIAKRILDLPSLNSRKLIVNEDVLAIGDPKEVSNDDLKRLEQCVDELKPWKKGPLNLMNIQIDTEWRSDWKWKRLQQNLPCLKNKVVCDLGCGNGYYMFRMLEYEPKLIVGVDPNLHAFLEFKLFQRLSGVDNIHFEYLRGDVMKCFAGAFDVVFCLGVLYHTPDPIGMLRDIHTSMKGNSVSSLQLKNNGII